MCSPKRQKVLNRPIVAETKIMTPHKLNFLQSWGPVLPNLEENSNHFIAQKMLQYTQIAPVNFIRHM